MTELQELMRVLEGIKTKQKTLAEKEAQTRAEIFTLMQDQDIEKEECSYGTVRFQRRYEKDYGLEIKAMENELKAAKKLKDDLGDFTTIGFKDSLVYVPPSSKFDLF